MIEFRGLLSKKAASFYYYRKLTLFFIWFLTGCCGAIPFMLFMRVLVGELAYLIFGGVVIIILSFFAVFVLPVFKNKCVQNGPKLICIGTELMVETKDAKEIRKFDNVTKIKEYRDFYVIYFNRRFNTFEFVCQKDLLTTGTLREFEALFDGKIVRKN